jgi:hypothetical protein
MNLRRLDGDNIDFVVDSILSSCLPVSQAYMDIIQGMVARQITNNLHYYKMIFIWLVFHKNVTL